MIKFDPNCWKHGENVTAREFCEYVKENIPHDAILHLCGSSEIYLHFSVDKKVFSLDCALSYLPEYGNCKVGELEVKERM